MKEQSWRRVAAATNTRSHNPLAQVLREGHSASLAKAALTAQAQIYNLFNRVTFHRRELESSSGYSPTPQASSGMQLADRLYRKLSNGEVDEGSDPRR
jgi:hypothetical protein